MNRILLLCLLLSLSLQSTAQTSTKDYGRKPLWIAMMADTSANYHEVEKAFTAYFNDHELPAQEDEEMNEHREREKTPSRRKLKRINAENKLRMDVKRYYIWHEQMLPYVKDDGYIMTPSQRIAIWKAQSGNK